MAEQETSAVTAVILPPNYTAITPPESFLSPLNGHCTWHTLISRPITRTDSLSAGVAICPPKTGNLCPHRHSQAEIYYILEGAGIVTIDGTAHKVERGSTVFIPGDAEHGIRNEGEMELKWFYVFPTESFGNIIYRFSHEMTS